MVKRSEMRLTWATAIAIATTLLIAGFYPQQIGVLLFKLNALALGAVCGYWLDRGIFPYARPSESAPEHAYMYRRVGLMGAVILGFALAL